MRHDVAQRWLTRGWFTAVLFTALFSRALIPMGFMPGPGGIVLCSGYALVPAAPYSPQTENSMSGHDMPGMDMSGKADHPHAGAPSQRHEGVEICLFSAVARAMAAGNAPSLAAFPLFIAGTTVFPPENSIRRGTIVPTSLPRGPPATA